MTLFPPDLSGIDRKKTPGKLEKRSLGKTGEMLSMIGFGGIVVMNATPEEASAAVRHAIDSGVNYFDVAPSYGDAELKLGPALEPYRKDVFPCLQDRHENKSRGTQRAGAVAEEPPH